MLINSFLSQRKFSVSVEGEMPTPREVQAGVPLGSSLSPTVYSIYINDASQTPGAYLPSLLTPVCMRQIARKVLLGKSSAVSAQWRLGVSDGILK
jgi:hypothetical protein